MKNSKILKYLLISVAFVLIVGAIATFMFRNLFISNDLIDKFENEISSYEGIEIIESQQTYGKLNGNGNGINYFGAVLLKADSTDSLDKIVSKLSNKYDIVEYNRQTSSQIDSYLLEHKSLSFDKSINPDEEYYCIYYFHSSDKSNSFDVAGH